MNDKQQLAAMGEHMAEQAGQEQPLCMAKRIEELEAQARVMAELLREAVSVISSINHGGEHEVHVEGDEPAFWQRGEWVEWAKRDVLPKLQSAMAGKLPESEAPVAKKPRITGVNGLDAGFSVKFPDGLDGEPQIHFQSLCSDGDEISDGHHICVMLAAANWLIDKAEWYRKGGAIIYQPRAMFFITPSPDGTK